MHFKNFAFALGSLVLAVLFWSLPQLASAQESLAGPRFFLRAALRVGVHDVRYDVKLRGYSFALRDLTGKALVEYRLPLGHAYLQRGVLRIEEATTGVVPMEHGGLSYRINLPPAYGAGVVISPYNLAFHPSYDPIHTGRLLSHKLIAERNAVVLRFRDEVKSGTATITTEKEYLLRLVGAALEITAVGDEKLRRAADYNYAGFIFDGGTGLKAPAQVHHIPYMDMLPVFMGADGVFTTRLNDWYVSNGSLAQGRRPAVTATGFVGETISTYYRNDKRELNAPVRETVSLVVSKTIQDLFPVIDRPPSSYRMHMAESAFSQNGPSNRYAKIDAWVKRAQALGIYDMAQIKWGWSKWPLNLDDPDFFRSGNVVPCGTLYGSEQQWLSYTRSCASGNWPLILYLSSDIMDPGYGNLTLQLRGGGTVLLTKNPLYDPSQCVQDAAGNRKKGWNTSANLANTNLKGHGHPTDVIGPHLFAPHVAAFAKRVHGTKGFKTGGLHIDAQTSIPSWNQIDQRQGSAFSHSIAETLRDRELEFRTAKDTMDGPLMGENGHWRYRTFATYAAGLLDGTSRKIPIAWSPPESPSLTNWDAAVIPDYELGEVMPKATAFFGMGWEFHFKASAYPVKDSFVDAWHTTLLSYGHAPYFGTNGDVPNNYWDWQRTLRSCHQTLGLSTAMRQSRVRDVRYEDAQGVEHSLEQALVLGMDLKHPRLVLRFENGLEFKANHSASSWTTKVGGITYTIPRDGFVGAAPSGLLALSAINPASGARVDYAKWPGRCEMIDRRGVNQSYNGFPGTLLPVPPGLFTKVLDDRYMVIIRDLRANQVIYAQNFETAAKALGAAPTLVSIRILQDDTSLLSLGRLRLGLRAVAKDSTGNERDVSGVVAWTSSAPGIATVNRRGMVMASGGIGRTKITATLVVETNTLKATHDVSAMAHPVFADFRSTELAAGQGLFSFKTRAHCVAAVAYYDATAGAPPILAMANSDPAGKQHQVHAKGLVRGHLYVAVMLALNGLSLFGYEVGAVFVMP